MGIPLPDPVFNSDCGNCFAANFTPALVHVSVTGIKKGEHWGPTIADPPNGMHALSSMGGCRWGKYSDPWTYRWSVIGSTSSFSINHDHLGFSFQRTRNVACAVHFLNSKIVPTLTEWWGGQAAVGFTAPLIGPSIQRVMSKLNIEVNSKALTDFVPVEDGQNIYRIARKKDKTNALIRFDYD